MANKLFLPFLTDDQGRSLDLENSVVVTKSIPDPLDHSPEGWEHNTIQFSRNTEFRGIIKAYITNLKFYLEGATILRNAFYRYGMETVLYFIWLKQNRSFGAGMKYESWYKGEPDFGTFKDEYDGVEINITEGGYTKDVQANKGVVQEVPFDQDTKIVYFEGTNFYSTLHYADVPGLQVPANTYGRYFFGPCSFLNQEGISTGLFFQEEVLAKAPNTFAGRVADLNVLVTNSDTKIVNVRIKGHIEILIDAIWYFGAAINFYILRSTADSINETAYPILQIPVLNIPDIGKVFSNDYDITFGLDPGESLYREGIFGSASDNDTIIEFTENSKFDIQLVTRNNPTYIRALKIFDFGYKINSKISTGSTMTSPVLQPDDNILVTNGDALRGLNSAIMQSNLSDWFTTVDAIKCLSFRIKDNNPVIVDRYSDFDKSKTIGSLGECSGWELEAASDYIYDTVESGYPTKSSQSTDDLNGKYSFNNTYERRIDVTRRVVNKYGCKATYFADPFDMSLIQLNLDGLTTTSAATDQSIFVLDCEKITGATFSGSINYTNPNEVELSGDITLIKNQIQPGIQINIKAELYNLNYTIISVVGSTATSIKFIVKEYVSGTGTVALNTVTVLNLYQLRRKAYASIVGVPDNTVFNLEISQMRNLMNHFRWLRSSFDHLDAHKLLFQSTDKNAGLIVTDLLGNVVAEGADIPVMNMGTKVFIPYLVKFTVKSPENLINLMTDNVGGKFNFTRNGLPMEGYPIDIKTDDTELTEQEYSLLLTDNNDLISLILNR